MHHASSRKTYDKFLILKSPAPVTFTCLAIKRTFILSMVGALIWNKKRNKLDLDLLDEISLGKE